MSPSAMPLAVSLQKAHFLPLYYNYNPIPPYSIHKAMSESKAPSSSSQSQLALYVGQGQGGAGLIPAVRDYRKGNWTVQETLTLITAKRLDDERRARGGTGGGTPTTPRSAEQRWKWVENYCWKNDCLRSQNQCNDKWDNLLRDYKKVRDYETRPDPNPNPNPNQPSYWSMERHERKERNLPTNLSPEVFHALTDVLSRRNARRSLTGGDVTPVSSRPPPPPPSPATNPLASPPPVAAVAPPSASAEGTDTSDSDACEPETKRRKVRSSLGSSVIRSASELARTLLACEDKREQRHRELLQLEERRLKIEEDRTEVNRQAVCGLISAVDNLSNAIHALVSGHRAGHGDQSRS